MAITRLTDNIRPLDIVSAINDNGADTVLRLSTTEATGSVSQGVYVDSNGVVQVCDAVTSTYSSSGTAPVNGTAVASAISGLQSASTAVKHTTSTAAGSATQPVYVASDGTATATTYSLGKSVPSDAVFTDTTYSDFTGANGTNAGVHGLVPAPSATDNTKYLKGDGTWATPAGVSVDQTYSSTSTNAQSGTAVAQAIGGKSKVTFVDWTVS